MLRNCAVPGPLRRAQCAGRSVHRHTQRPADRQHGHPRNSPWPGTPNRSSKTSMTRQDHYMPVNRYGGCGGHILLHVQGHQPCDRGAASGRCRGCGRGEHHRSLDRHPRQRGQEPRAGHDRGHQPSHQLTPHRETGPSAPPSPAPVCPPAGARNADTGRRNATPPDGLKRARPGRPPARAGSGRSGGGSRSCPGSGPGAS
jgi:hypothetical protein